MSNLSKLFQTSALSYNLGQPSIQSTKSRISTLDNPLDDLTRNMAAGGKFARAELMVTQPNKAFLSGMFEKYKNGTGGEH